MFREAGCHTVDRTGRVFPKAGALFYVEEIANDTCTNLGNTPRSTVSTRWRKRVNR